MAVLHMNKHSKEESSIKVSGVDAKKVSTVLLENTKKVANDNLSFLKSVTKSLKKL